MTILLSRPRLSVVQEGAKVRLEMALENGAPINDTTVASEMVMALSTPRGSCPSDPDYGSLLHTLTKRTRGVDRFAEMDTRRTWRTWIDRGEVRDLKVKATARGSALFVAATYKDRAGNPRKVTYTHNLR